MDNLISQNQSSFVGGRQIQDNLIIVQEPFHWLRRKSRGSSQVTALKLDLSKAYDRLEWPFIQQCLLAYGFNPRWVNMKINLSKSGLIYGRLVPPPVRLHPRDILEVEEWPNPGKYLGLPGEWGISRINSLGWLKDIFLSKIEG
ncbi:Reverse transcriptase domain [Sesbania bispinosa]|nr:Reverse transcriptase domain [Sesbania bispinosa]